MKKMTDRLKEYLANTSEEQLKADFEALKEWNNIGPTVDEFLEETKKYQKIIKHNKVVRTDIFPSAYLETFADGTGRVTFFNETNHWAGDINLTKEQIDFYYSE